MTFSPAKPADEQKIRLGPGDSRDNFSAIVTGDTSFTPAKVNLAVQGADPAALAANAIIYSKIVTGPDAELHMEDSTGNVIQMTDQGDLGSINQSLAASTISFDATTPAMTFGINQMVMATATVSATGSLTNGVNVTSSTRTSNPGQYTITVAADVLLNDNFRVIGMVDNPTSNSIRQLQMRVKPSVVAATPTVIPLRVVGDSALHNEPFDVIIIGGR